MTDAADWQRLADGGDVVAAIKVCRATTGVPLAEAKATVERWLGINRPPSVAYQAACRMADRVGAALDGYFARAERPYTYCIHALSPRQSAYCGDPPLIALQGTTTASESDRCDLVVFIELDEVPAGRERAAARAALAGGKQLVWILQPDLTGVRVEAAGKREVTHLYDDAVLDGGDVLPGFACKVSDLFA